jgi:RNA polymerase sigma factor (sigma-70 family)
MCAQLTCGSPLDQGAIADLLKLVERTARTLARRKGLSPQDTDDFAQDALVKFIENDYAVYRKFRGDAQLATYVASVISRLLIDRVIGERGKFRPSPEATEYGETAVHLERYVYRDGLTFSAAGERLRTDHGVTLNDTELESLFSKLPRRYRREHLGPTPLNHLPAHDSAEDAILDDERRQRNTRFAGILEKCKRSIASQDALILSYWEREVRPGEIARTLGIPAKRVYNRVEALKKLLQRLLKEEGIESSMT